MYVLQVTRCAAWEETSAEANYFPFLDQNFADFTFGQLKETVASL
ncbi:MAG: hypothetical protein ACK5ND_09705 [Bacteroides sp.]